MSLHTLNGDSISEGIAAESCAILFTPAETTGRTSILRPSQKENVPPKGIVKPMKVTFQTPVRDPQTRRILSPDIKKKPEISLIAEIPDNLLLTTCNTVRNQPTITTEITSAKEKIQPEGKVTPDPSDDLTYLPTVSVVESFKSSDSLLNYPNSQKLSLLEVLTGTEKQDGFSLSCDSVCLPQTVAENIPSGETGCTTESNLSLASLLHDDVSKQILNYDHATNITSNRACNLEPLPMLYLQNSPLPHMQKLCSFENLNSDKINNSEENSGTEIKESWVPKVSYKLDCINFDPDFNTFGCGPNIQDSTECPAPCVEKSDVRKDEADSLQTQELNVPDKFETMELTAESQRATDDRILTDSQAVVEKDAQGEPSGEIMVSQRTILSETSDQGNMSLDGQLLVGDLAPRPLCGSTETGSESNQLFTESEEFRPPMEVFGIQIDYLEQFGMASLKESVLRKQSLYLKFDPLLSESPKKKGPDTNEATLPVAALLQNGTSTKTASIEVKSSEQEEKLLGLDFQIFPDLGKTSPDFPTSNNMPLFSCAQSSEAIIDVLKYSQKDMDEVLQKVKLDMDAVVQTLTAEVQEKQREALEWKRKHDKIYAESKEMEKIVAEFEGTITQVMEDSQIQKELAKKELQKVLDEKQQVISDLNAVEKSFSEFFKRFKKQKEAIEGFQRNEEALKKCVEDYLERIKKEEQRYQALKAHAEEKLHQANEEIAQVRSKAKTEVVALQASLRKEQMRIQSLERSIEQKTKENDELTKICDDLISKVEKMC
ncbi:transforming acidic coiled-coil-containing protein 3 isoform X2 [Python bivittatus]|uniref:Transforming acidic coiled-coil-containing protein 3 isoform X2 n=1 Tax=Python bivittatus TaxID=176946 RepID=A0A9F5ISB6_PYTBI|nr:transforming acidic coiled-coil-containing protein 3 isoform X2 [Python bivittatus]